MRGRRLVAGLALAAAACGGGNATTIEGVWYGDDGRTVLITASELRLDSGELLASVEPLGETALRYAPADGTAPRTLQVAFPTTLRMTWTELDGTPFRELTRVAGPE
jgi:hypothetical protein